VLRYHRHVLELVGDGSWAMRDAEGYTVGPEFEPEIPLPRTAE